MWPTDKPPAPSSINIVNLILIPTLLVLISWSVKLVIVIPPPPVLEYIDIEHTEYTFNLVENIIHSLNITFNLLPKFFFVKATIRR